MNVVRDETTSIFDIATVQALCVQQSKCSQLNKSSNDALPSITLPIEFACVSLQGCSAVTVGVCHELMKTMFHIPYLVLFLHHQHILDLKH